MTTNIRQTKITEYYKKVTKCNENHPQKNEILFQETIKENKPPKSASSPILIQRNSRKRSHEDSGNESSSCKSIKHDSKDDASSNLLSNKAKIEMTPIEPPKILSPAISLEEPYQVEKDMGHSIMEQKMRSILAWLNFPTKNSYETIANLEHKMDNMNYMDNLHSGRTAEFNQQCDKITTSQNENNELNIFNVQDNEMSKEGTNFDVKDFRRNLLVNLMLNGGMDEFEKVI